MVLERNHLEHRKLTGISLGCNFISLEGRPGYSSTSVTSCLRFPTWNLLSEPETRTFKGHVPRGEWEAVEEEEPAGKRPVRMCPQAQSSKGPAPAPEGTGGELCFILSPAGSRRQTVPPGTCQSLVEDSLGCPQALPLGLRCPSSPRTVFQRRGCCCPWCPGRSDVAACPLHLSAGGKQLPHRMCTSIANPGQVAAAADGRLPNKQTPRCTQRGPERRRRGQRLSCLLKTCREGMEPSCQH